MSIRIAQDTLVVGSGERKRLTKLETGTCMLR